MTSHRAKWAMTGFLVLTLSGVAQDKKPAAPPGREWIDRRIQEIEPAAKERRFDAIGWVSGIRAAERLANENGRPVFLFSNVGQMDIGRC
jgi:hypothetical protein